MKTIDTIAAQGEIYITRIGAVAPKDFFKGGMPLKLEGGRYIIGHSETGHHHVLDREGVTVVEMPSETSGIRLLRALIETPDKALEHERGYDTHEAIGLPPGAYEFRTGREYDPYAQRARMQAD